MRHIKHPAMIRLISDIVERIPVSEKGTYNQQDPTAYTKGSIDVRVGDNTYRLKQFSPWGTELEIYLVRYPARTLHEQRPKLLCAFYIDDDVTPRQDELWIDTLFNIRKALPELEPEIDEYFDDPRGHPSQYI